MSTYMLYQLPIKISYLMQLISIYTLFLTMTWYQYVGILKKFRMIFTKKLYIWTTFFKPFINIMIWFVQNIDLIWKFLLVLQIASHQKMFQEFTPPQKTGKFSRDISSLSNESTSLLEGVTNTTIVQSINTNASDSMVVLPSSIDTTHKFSHDIHILILHAVDKPSTSLPNTIMMSEDYLRACVGFF